MEKLVNAIGDVEEGRGRKEGVVSDAITAVQGGEG